MLNQDSETIDLKLGQTKALLVLRNIMPPILCICSTSEYKLNDLYTSLISIGYSVVDYRKSSVDKIRNIVETHNKRDSYIAILIGFTPQQEKNGEILIQNLTNVFGDSNYTCAFLYINNRKDYIANSETVNNNEIQIDFKINTSCRKALLEFFDGKLFTILI